MANIEEHVMSKKQYVVCIFACLIVFALAFHFSLYVIDQIEHLVGLCDLAAELNHDVTSDMVQEDCYPPHYPGIKYLFFAIPFMVGFGTAWYVRMIAYVIDTKFR